MPPKRRWNSLGLKVGFEKGKDLLLKEEKRVGRLLLLNEE